MTILVTWQNVSNLLDFPLMSPRLIVVCHCSMHFQLKSFFKFKHRTSLPLVNFKQIMPTTQNWICHSHHLFIILKSFTPALNFGKSPWDFHHPWPPNPGITMYFWFL
jgi:hypothetical protein